MLTSAGMLQSSPAAVPVQLLCLWRCTKIMRSTWCVSGSAGFVTTGNGVAQIFCITGHAMPDSMRATKLPPKRILYAPQHHQQ